MWVSHAHLHFQAACKIEYIEGQGFLIRLNIWTDTREKISIALLRQTKLCLVLTVMQALATKVSSVNPLWTHSFVNWKKNRNFDLLNDLYKVILLNRLIISTLCTLIVFLIQDNEMWKGNILIGLNMTI